MNKVAVLFPGQGSQYVGMGKNIYEEFSSVRKIFEEASDSIGVDLKALCFDSTLAELTKTQNTQPAVLTVSYSMFHILTNEMGIEPEYLAGHSLGEISAITCAGGIKFSDAIKIVRKRGQSMQDVVPIGVGAMSAISNCDIKIIEAQCKNTSTETEQVFISNHNSTEQIVISGHKNAVNSAGKSLKEIGARVTPLNVSAPFHSPLMQPAADIMQDEMKKYEYYPLKYPVISNVTAQPYIDYTHIIKNLTMQIVQSVRWHESMVYLKNQGAETAIEAGPKNILKVLMLKNVPEIKTYSFDKENDQKSIKKEMNRNIEEDSDLKDKGMVFIRKCIAEAVCTKNRNWNENEYNEGVVETFNKMKQIKENLENSNLSPDLEDMEEVFKMLKKVLETKLIDHKEQKEILNDVLTQSGTKHVFKEELVS